MPSLRLRSALRNTARKYLDINDFVDYVLTVAVQGSHSTASTVWIQAVNPEGRPILATDQLRVRVADALGTVVSTSVTAGSGYSGSPTVIFAPPTTPGGVTATGTVTLSGGGYSAITLTNAGSGYTVAPGITVGGATGGTGASATATLAGGYAVATSATIAASSFSEVTAVNVLLGGANYISAPTVGFTGGGGSAAAATATIDPISGELTGIVVTAGGTGYTSVPTVTLTGGGGTGATAQAVVSNPTAEGGTTLLNAITANVDLNLQSNNQGLYSITLTSVGSIKTLATLLLGAPPVNHKVADYSETLTVTHA